MSQKQNPRLEAHIWTWTVTMFHSMFQNTSCPDILQRLVIIKRRFGFYFVHKRFKSVPEKYKIGPLFAERPVSSVLCTTYLKRKKKTIDLCCLTDPRIPGLIPRWHQEKLEW